MNFLPIRQLDLTREQGGVIAEELNQPLIVDHVVE